MKVVNKWIAVASMVTLGLVSTGCGSGSNSFISSVQVQMTTINGDPWVNLTALLKTGNAIVPSLDIGLMKNGEVVGRIALQQVFGATPGTQISIGIDTAKAAGLHELDNALPNGNPLPIANASQGVVLGFTIPNTNAKVYFGFGNGVAFVGAALAMSVFDGVGHTVGNAELFIPFNIGSIAGTAGIFTSATSGKGGFGVFADVSQAIGNILPRNSNLRMAMSALDSSASQAYRFNTVKTTSNSNALKIQKAANKLLKDGARLELR